MVGCQPNESLGTEDSAGSDAQEEGPLWVGPLYDVDAVRGMAEIARLEEAKGLISKENRSLLETILEEAAVNSMFHCCPGVATIGTLASGPCVTVFLFGNAYLDHIRQITPETVVCITNRPNLVPPREKPLAKDLSISLSLRQLGKLGIRQRK